MKIFLQSGNKYAESLAGMVAPASKPSIQLKPEDPKFKTSLGYIVRVCLKNMSIKFNFKEVNRRS